MQPLSGANLVNIIIPEKVNFLGGSLGHSNIYFMKDYQCSGDYVPTFWDFPFRKVPTQAKEIIY